MHTLNTIHNFLTHFLLSQIGQCFGLTFLWGDALGMLTGTAYVYLATRQRSLAWPISLLNTIIYVLILPNEELPANGILQILYFFMGLYGWYQWRVPHSVQSNSPEISPLLENGLAERSPQDSGATEVSIDNSFEQLNPPSTLTDTANASCLKQRSFLSEHLRQLQRCLNIATAPHEHHKTSSDDKNTIKKLPHSQITYALLASIILSSACYITFQHWNANAYSSAAMTFADAALTGTSLVLTWLEIKKYLDAWIGWFIIDCGYILTYTHQQLYLSSFLSAIYVGFSVYGFLSWNKILLKHRNNPDG